MVEGGNEMDEFCELYIIRLNDSKDKLVELEILSHLLGTKNSHLSLIFSRYQEQGSKVQ